MKLTEKDKKYLQSIGYAPSDFPQIEAAARHTTYERGREEPGTVNVKISQNEAIQLLGREKFLSGLSRSAFHWSALQEIENGENIYYDSSRLFRQA